MKSWISSRQEASPSKGVRGRSHYFGTKTLLIVPRKDRQFVLIQQAMLSATIKQDSSFLSDRKRVVEVSRRLNAYPASARPSTSAVCHRPRIAPFFVILLGVLSRWQCLSRERYARRAESSVSLVRVLMWITLLEVLRNGFIFAHIVERKCA